MEIGGGPRRRLVVILGAGASADIAPTVAQLTNCVPMTLEPATWKRLRDEIPEFDSLSFEDVIDAGVVRSTALSRCAQLLPRASALLTSTETYLKASVQMINGSIEVRETKASIPRVLDALAECFDVTVATLNWDDLPLRCNTSWYSGFNQDCFDGKYLDAYREHGQRILWLHGSVHFQVVNHMAPYIRWENDGGEISTRTNLLNSLKESVVYGPLITARNKVSQTYVRPFLDYQNVLYHDILAAVAVLAIGYSGADPDVNAVIQAAMREDRNGDKVIVRVDYDWREQDLAYALCGVTKIFGLTHPRFCPPGVGSGSISPTERFVVLTGPGARAPASCCYPKPVILDLGGVSTLAENVSGLLSVLP